MHTKIIFPLVPLGIISNIKRTELYTFLTHILVFLTQPLNTIKPRSAIITPQFIPNLTVLPNKNVCFPSFDRSRADCFWRKFGGCSTERWGDNSY